MLGVSQSICEFHLGEKLMEKLTNFLFSLCIVDLDVDIILVGGGEGKIVGFISSGSKAR